MWLQPHGTNMSTDRQYPMGMHHMTVVPENFDPFDDPDIEDAADDAE